MKNNKNRLLKVGFCYSILNPRDSLGVRQSFNVGISNEVKHVDLRKAVDVMLKKHPTCRWRSEKVRIRKYFILVEGYDWIKFVYFEKEKSLMVADINFFEDRIKQYEELLKVEKNKNWWNEDMDIKQLCKYFYRKEIKKMCDSGFGEYKFLINNKVVISSNGVKWICKNVFKQKYLELLEKYKMELTELYIEKGYIYDELFGRN